MEALKEIILKRTDGKTMCWSYSDEDMFSLEKVFDFFYHNNKNFMTPYPEQYGVFKKNDIYYFYELSWGEGILHNRIYGLTIIEGSKKHEDGEVLYLKTSDLSCGGKSKRELLAYLESLKEKGENHEG